jgi:hypothetical protein
MPQAEAWVKRLAPEKANRVAAATDHLVARGSGTGRTSRVLTGSTTNTCEVTERGDRHVTEIHQVMEGDPRRTAHR